MTEKVEEMNVSGVDISPENDGKLMKEILVPGVDIQTPNKGNKVSVHYTGTLTDGTKFDSSVDRNEEFVFTLGKGEVIKAWDLGVATMTKGEKCRLTCHADFAYGKAGSPPKIPKDATLIFEIELISWELEDLSPDSDKGILRSIIQEGEGYLTPNDGAIVEVHLIGKHDGKVFEEKDVNYEIGEAEEAGVVDGLDTALKKFKKGEKSVITLSPQYAFGSSGKTEFNIPPNSTVEYEVTLKSFEKEKETWNMTAAEKLEQSEIVKNKGTNYFKLGKYELASRHYNKIVTYLQYESDMEEESKKQKSALLLAGYLNLAACFLKLEKYSEALKNCDKALEIEPKNAKALFRKGQAHFGLTDYEPARKDFELALEVDNNNKAVQKQIYLCKEKIKQDFEKEKKLYKAIFQRMAEESAKESDITNNDQSEPFVKMQTDDEKQAAAEGAVNA